jgi:photosystem II stability/assembly factor-like uncharacterized protein
MTHPLIHTMRASLLAIGVLFFACPAAPQTENSLRFSESATPYQWDNVVIGGGGWMVAIVAHPKIPDLLWLGSDVSGPWKREPGSDRWRAQAWNHWSPRNVSGIGGMALDPRDGNTVYVERGDPNGDSKKGLFVTRDGGKTWSLALNKYSLSNAGPARKWGPSIVVDPNNPDVVYWGTFRDGVWRSLDAGKTWSQVMPPPPLAAGQKPDVLDPGVRCLAIDPRTKVEGRSAIVYASLEVKSVPAKPAVGKPAETLLSDAVCGIYRSTDGGNSFVQLAEFNALPGHPKSVRHMACGTDGTLLASHEAGLARLDAGGWKNITPSVATAFEQGALAVHPAHPQEVLFIARSKPKGQGKYYHQSLFRSRDGGRTWNWVSNDEEISVSEALPWNKKMPIASSGSGLAFDPHHPGRAYLLDAFMVYQTDNVWAERPVFRALWQGVDNTVVLTLCTPPASKDGNAPVLLSGLGDIRGFRHADIHQPPTVYVEPPAGKVTDWVTNVTGYDYCEGNSAVIMCAKHDDRMRPGQVLLSTDGGKTWKQTTDPLGKNYGGAKIAVSARWDGSTDTLKAVLAPGNGQLPHYTRDGGKTWAVCKAADGTDLKTFSYLNHPFSFSQYLAADRVDGDAFYLYRFSGEFWVSRDGGATWKRKDFKKTNAVIWDSKSPMSIQAAPGRAGEVWAALADFGIRRSRDFGETWESLPGIVQSNKLEDLKVSDTGRPCLVTFGAPAPGKPANEPTVFVFARLRGEDPHSLLRSSDIVAEKLSDMTWQRVQKWEFGGILPNMMRGSRQNFGQIFTSGSDHGVIYGEPSK